MVITMNSLNGFIIVVIILMEIYTSWHSFSRPLPSIPPTENYGCSLTIFSCLRNEQMSWDGIYDINKCCISCVCLRTLPAENDSSPPLNICPVFLSFYCCWRCLQVFRKARAVSPSIVFFDEIDALASERGRYSMLLFLMALKEG